MRAVLFFAMVFGLVCGGLGTVLGCTADNPAFTGNPPRLDADGLSPDPFQRVNQDLGVDPIINFGVTQMTGAEEVTVYARFAYENGVRTQLLENQELKSGALRDFGTQFDPCDPAHRPFVEEAQTNFGSGVINMHLVVSDRPFVSKESMVIEPNSVTTMFQTPVGAQFDQTSWTLVLTGSCP